MKSIIKIFSIYIFLNEIYEIFCSLYSNFSDMLENGNVIYCPNRETWRIWLKDNHKNKKEIWLIYYKKFTKKPRVDYSDAVEEALCFGWIDSIVKRIDDERYMQRFTPRRVDSNWSEINKGLAEKLIESGKMNKAGLKQIKAAKRNGKWGKITHKIEDIEFSNEILNIFVSNESAYKLFKNLTDNQQKRLTAWVMSARKEETKIKRINKILFQLKKNGKIDLMKLG